MLNSMNIWIFVVVCISVLISLTNPRGETDKTSSASIPSFTIEASSVQLVSSSDDGSTLDYDFYRQTCPQAQAIVRSAMSRFYFENKGVSANLLRLFFHDCFIEGCDASVLLDDSNGDKSRSIERQAVPNRSLKGFDKIDLIKEELERACPGVVSCSDIISIATRDVILLAGGPFYPLLKCRKDSTQSFYEEELADIPRPEDNITQDSSSV